MIRRTAIALTFASLAASAGAGEAPRDYELTLAKVRDLQVALSSLERRESVCLKNGKDEPCILPVPTCLGDIKAGCLPVEQSYAIASNLAAIATHWDFYQRLAHQIISDVSGGSGLVKPGSDEETRGNFRLFDLGMKAVTVRLAPISVRAIEGTGVQISPSTKAVLSVISE